MDLNIPAAVVTLVKFSSGLLLRDIVAQTGLADSATTGPKGIAPTSMK